ncbi:heme-degrading domain-containing protein [Pseudonocardia nematodicida]|uniref:Heme-degrading domain-containing protein n=1 Tax=Pseudonocardia nematodicida TaxID=1206997 RepID=A0ABV1K7C4_9PSEU
MSSSTATALDRLRAEEDELVLDGFTRDDAWALGSRLRAAAVTRGFGLSIGVVLGRQRVFHCALDGATPDNDAWLERKIAVVLHYQRSSLAVAEQFAARGWSFEAESRLPADDYAARGGAFPVRVRGTGVVGALGVSGLPHVEDHAFVVEQLRAFLAEVS